jgi:hypothetical protein
VTVTFCAKDIAGHDDHLKKTLEEYICTTNDRHKLIILAFMEHSTCSRATLISVEIGTPISNGTTYMKLE